MFKLFRFLKPYWWQAILAVSMVAFQVWCTLQLPTLMADIVNYGITNNDTGYIWQTGIVMFAYAIAGACAAIIGHYFSSKVGTGFARDLRSAVFSKVINFSVSEMKNFSTASLITRTTNDVSQVQQTVITILSMMIRAPLMCIIAIILAINTAPNMTWIIAIAGACILTLIISVMFTVLPKFKIFQKLVDRVTLITRENLTGLRVIRAFNNEKLEKKKFNEANTNLTNTMVFIDKVMALQVPLINLVFNGTTLLCSWVGISLLSLDISYLGNMIAFAQYVGQIILSFLMISMLFIMLPRANVSAARINEILDAKPKIRWKNETSGIPEKSPSVEFKNVDFMYDDAEEKILQNISFIAKAGETTAFIGSTGSGKSTLINLIPRFYEATNGEILVNNINIKDYAKDDLISRIGYVPQRGILFSGNVASNISFGAPNATKEQIRTAAEISQSKEFVERLPEKYQSHIAQGGSNVSGGQKQRLSIARAIVKSPDVFIFDDSFSALDMKTDAKLREALKPITKDAVTLIVAQRVSTIKDAEQIIVLDNGKIVGKGDHHSLLNTCAVYQEIVKSQLSGEEYNKELKEAANARA